MVFTLYISVCILIIIAMILGEFQPHIFFRTCSIGVGVVIFVIYWISQYYQHEPPFPKCWISGVAQHYPQYVYFRIGTISGSVLMAMGWFTNHFYIKTICKQNVINIKKHHPQIILVSGLISSFALMGSTAYIDTGTMDAPDHQHCAAIFFGAVLFAQICNTVLFIQLSAYKIVNKTLVWMKIIQLILIIIQGFISVMYGVQGAKMFGQMDASLGNDVGKFIQWSMTYTVLLGFLIMSFDVSNFSFVYEKTAPLKQQGSYVGQKLSYYEETD